jgi:hypothetical protein
MTVFVVGVVSQRNQGGAANAANAATVWRTKLVSSYEHLKRVY